MVGFVPLGLVSSLSQSSLDGGFDGGLGCQLNTLGLKIKFRSVGFLAVVVGGLGLLVVVGWLWVVVLGW